MKRFLIISIFLLLVGAFMRWLAPPLIYTSLGKQLAKHDIELTCLNWHLSGFQQVNIEDLCLHYQGIDLDLSNAQVRLMQSAFWQNDFSWKNLVPAVSLEKLEILLPEKLHIANDRDKAVHQAPQGVPDFWLPDIHIQQLSIISADENAAPLNLSLSLEQQKLNRVLQLESDTTAETFNFSLIHHQQKQRFEFAWQLDLSWLDTHLRQLMPLLMAETSTPDMIALQSGRLQGKLDIDVNNPLAFQSQHRIEDLKMTLSHEKIAVPIAVNISQQFEMNREGNKLNLDLAGGGNMTLSDISALANNFLQKYQWKGLQAAIPESGLVTIELPTSISIGLQEDTGHLDSIRLNAFLASNLANKSTQKIQFNDISWVADTNEIAASFNTSNQITLKNKSHTDTLNALFKGDIEGSVKAGSVKLRDYSLTGFTGNTELIPDLPEIISWQDTELTGSGVLQWQEKSWSVVTDYQARLTNLQTGPVSLDEVSSQGGVELNNQQLRSRQTVSITPDIPLTVVTSGELNELNINAELPTTNLNLVNAIAHQLDPLISISDGVISSSIKATIASGKLNTADIILDIKQAAASWQDYYISDLNTRIPLSLNSSFEIMAQPKKLSIAEVNTGAAVHHLDSQFLIAGSLSEPRFQLQHLTGEVFNGNFSLERLNYPLTLNSEALLRIEQFNLNDLVNLFGDQGIEVTGTISGDIPLSFSEGLVSVEQAMVKADGEGQLRIEDNAGFQNLKNSQQTLGLALSLLEDLHYTTLQSEVHLEPDGLMTLAVNISGVNHKEAQPINFNPTLTTNLYTGLKALRAGQNIAESIEQKLDQ